MSIVSSDPVRSLVTAFLLLAGCAGTDRQSARTKELDQAALIQLAKDELGRRGLDLPRFYEVEFENGEIGNEIGPPRPIYSVAFLFVYRGHKRAVYTVFIDKRSHKIDQVSDYRATVPSRAWHRAASDDHLTQLVAGSL